MDKNNLDEKDLEILKFLSENCDASKKKIAEKVGLSDTSIGSRIKRMKKEQVKFKP